MDNKSHEDVMESSSSEASVSPIPNSGSQSQGPTGFGEWLEGREVGKLFGGKLFNGKVAEFDKEVGWYKLVYEDGNSEDLDWHELVSVLVPLDLNIPFKTLALKIAKKRQKNAQKSTKGKIRTRNDDSNDGKGNIEGVEHK